jgi:hypothetical protein
MTTVRFTMTSSQSAPQLAAVITDFSAARPAVWPTIDAQHFEVHAIGDTWAEVTEGTASAWERARYDWSELPDRITITTLDSKVFGPGGGWIFHFTPQTSGTGIDIELTRNPRKITRRVLASLLPLVAPRSLRKSFAGPLQAT